jgi:branched-chain amino acid transport system permease protein
MSRRWKWLIAFVFLAIVIVLPQFITNPYYTHLMILIMMNSVLAMTFIMLLRAGLLNMSMAAFWGIGAYTAGMLTLKGGLSFWVALPTSIAISALVALAIGAILVRHAGLGFIIPSLIFAFIVPLVFGTFKTFGGHVGLIRIPAPNAIPLPGGAQIAFVSETSYYYLLLVFSVIVVMVLLALYRAWTGRAWRALGLSANLAESVSINPFRYRLLGFVIVSAMAALMGVFFAAYSSNIQPESYGPFKAIYIQMFAILGGVGSPIIGPLIGAGILTIIPEALRAVKNFEPMVTGALIILILIFMPQGIIGLIQGRRPGEAWEFLSNAIRGRRRSTPPVPQADVEAVLIEPGGTTDGDPEGQT